MICQEYNTSQEWNLFKLGLWAMTNSEIESPHKQVGRITTVWTNKPGQGLSLSGRNTERGGESTVGTVFSLIFSVGD